MMIIGQRSAPAWVWVSAPRVGRIRTRPALTGLPVIGMALVFGIALVVIGLNLPSSHSPINVIGVMTAGIGAFWGSGGSGRSCARWRPGSAR
jgi:hypothetical protein